MQLRDVKFRTVLGASGVQDFFGKGYWFHPYLTPFGLDFAGSTFVAKTTTFSPRAGNMPLRDDFAPREFLPKCIYVKPWQGIALNAVGLSGPGALALFSTGRWQARKEPFFLSFMSVAATAGERLVELKKFVELFASCIQDFCAPVGLQINYSCPNVGMHLDGLLNEVADGLAIAGRLNIPLMPKFNLLLPPEVARDIGNHPQCDALCVSNTIPYGQMPNRIDWKKLFGSVSPLVEFGGGGLSGKPLLPFLLLWLMRVRRAGFTKPINAGGGILSLADARSALAFADSISLGSIAFLRPWRVRGIITALNRTHTAQRRPR